MIHQDPVFYDHLTGEILFFNWFENYIYTLDENDDLDILYEIDFGKYNITEKDRQKYKVHELAALCSDGLRKGYLDYLHSNSKFIGFEYNYNENYTEFCIYSKKNGRSVSSEQIRNMGYDLPLGRIVHLGLDYFVCAVEPDKVIEFLESSQADQYGFENLEVGTMNNLVLVYYSISM